MVKPVDHESIFMMKLHHCTKRISVCLLEHDLCAYQDKYGIKFPAILPLYFRFHILHVHTVHNGRSVCEHVSEIYPILLSVLHGRIQRGGGDKSQKY